MTTARTNPSPRPPRQERLLPLLCRYASQMYYRRSPRFAQHQARVGPRATLPVPPLADVLAVYLAQRLPAWFVTRYGPTGLFRIAKLLAGVLGALSLLIRPASFLAKLLWRGLKRTMHSPAADPCYVRRVPAGNAAVVLGDSVRFRGCTYADDRLCCYLERIRPVRNPGRIVVRLYPERPGALSPASVADGWIAKDHNPIHPLPVWPRGRAYRAAVSLADLPPGDYRVEIGLLDVVSRELLTSAENGCPLIDCGWVRVAGTPPRVEQHQVAGATHGAA